MGLKSFLFKIIGTKDDNVSWIVNAKYEAYLDYIESTKEFKLTKDSHWELMTKIQNSFDGNYFLRADNFCLRNKELHKIVDLIEYYIEVYNKLQEDKNHPEFEKYLMYKRMKEDFIYTEIVRDIEFKTFLNIIKSNIQRLQDLKDNFTEDYVIKKFGISANTYMEEKDILGSEEFNDMEKEKAIELLFMLEEDREKKRALLKIYDTEIRINRHCKQKELPRPKGIMVNSLSFSSLE